MLQLGDFGLCRRLSNTTTTEAIEATYISLVGGLLPYKWLALEAWLRSEFSAKSDVFV